jgi:hypothetical protein
LLNELSTRLSRSTFRAPRTCQKSPKKITPAFRFFAASCTSCRTFSQTSIDELFTCKSENTTQLLQCTWPGGASMTGRMNSSALFVFRSWQDNLPCLTFWLATAVTLYTIPKDYLFLILRYVGKKCASALNDAARPQYFSPRFLFPVSHRLLGTRRTATRGRSTERFASSGILLESTRAADPSLRVRRLATTSTMMNYDAGAAEKAQIDPAGSSRG